MSFQWPAALVAALAVPGLLWLYGRVHQQRIAVAMRHPNLHAHATGMRTRSIVRHVPLALVLASLVAVTLALARPQVLTTRFAVNGTVLLLVDVSISMRANDAEPSRLARSQALAKAFVAEYADTLRIGLVSIAGDAAEEMEPTTDREALFAAIGRLGLRPGTELGSGIKSALAALLPDLDIDEAAAKIEREAARPNPRDTPAQSPPTAPGAYSEAAVVLISDGQSASGPEPETMARLAASLGVRIHTIGVGSAEGRTMNIEGWRMRVQLDEAVLKAIAKLTGGEYFAARADIDWARIADAVRPVKPRVPAYTEVTALFAGAAAMLALAGALVSLACTKRIL
jgi:Ca-activated chloride channel family protein